MNFYRRLAMSAGLAAGLVGGAAIGAANAQVSVFNSFDTNFTNSGFGDCVTGADFSGCFSSGPTTEWIAAPFSPSATGTLDYFYVAANYLSGTNGIIVSLVDDHGGSPAPLTTVLETYYVANVPAPPPPPRHPQPKVKLTSKTHPTLTKGDTYWLVMTPVGYDGWITWYLSSSNLTPAWFSTDGGNNWNQYGSGAPNFTLPAMAVYEQ